MIHKTEPVEVHGCYTKMVNNWEIWRLQFFSAQLEYFAASALTPRYKYVSVGALCFALEDILTYL